MCKFVTFGLVLVSFFAFTLAQSETQKGEVFGGFSFLHYEDANMLGGEGSVAVNVTPWFAIKGDISAHFGQLEDVIDINSFTFLVGPQFSGTSGKARPFVHALFGGTRVSAGLLGVSANEGGFAFAVGGGCDVRVTEHFAIRAFQADFVGARIEGEQINALRLGSGVVARF